MAVKKGDEYFTSFTHTESGRVLTRRLHQLEIQARDGRIYTLRGENLPDFIHTSAGEGFKGEHLGQILLNPKAVSTWPNFVSEPRPWPCGRDVLNFVLGFFAVAMLRFFASLLGLV